MRDGERENGEIIKKEGNEKIWRRGEIGSGMEEGKDVDGREE